MTDQLKYIPYIDGLRALAVLIVVLFHLDVAIFTGGFIGVDIFFVLSGFLITRIISNEITEQRFSLIRFYARRVSRIFPALFVMIWVSCLGAILFFAPDEYGYHLKSARMAAVQFSNFFFAGELNYFDDSHNGAALLHTWSLGVEEQYYFVWPLILWGVLVSRLRRIQLILIGFIIFSSLVFSEYLTRHDTIQAFYMLHARAWELLLGGVLALGLIPQIRQQVFTSLCSYAGFILIMIGCFWLDDSHFPGFNALFPCVGTALIIYGARGTLGTTYFHRVLSFQPVVFIGRISYSLYLWHWPVIIFYKTLIPGVLAPFAQILLFSLSLVLSVLSYYFVETPFRKRNAPPWKVLLCGALVIVFTLVGTNLLKKHAQAPWRITAPIDESISKPNQWVKACSVEGGAYDKDNCIIGPNKERYEVILAGDSHASHYIPTVLEWAKKRGLTVRLFMRGACKTWVENEAPRFKAGKRDVYCEDLSEDFFKEIEDAPSLQYVFLALRKPKGSSDEISSLRHLAETNKKVVYMGPNLEFERNPNTCYVREHLFIRSLLPDLKAKEQNCYDLNFDFNEKILRRTYDDFVPALHNIGIRHFDVTSYMRDAIDDQGRFMYMDDNHLNVHGARYLVPYFETFMDDVDQQSRLHDTFD